MCPKCKHTFHRVGHHHSFNDIQDIKRLLGSEFEILDVGEVFAFQKISDIIRNILTKISEKIFKNKSGLTLYFVARVNKITI